MEFYIHCANRTVWELERLIEQKDAVIIYLQDQYITQHIPQFFPQHIPQPDFEPLIPFSTPNSLWYDDIMCQTVK